MNLERLIDFDNLQKYDALLRPYLEEIIDAKIKEALDKHKEEDHTSVEE